LKEYLTAARCTPEEDGFPAEACLRQDCSKCGAAQLPVFDDAELASDTTVRCGYGRMQPVAMCSNQQKSRGVAGSKKKGNSWCCARVR
jgi:hypothetical protein